MITDLGKISKLKDGKNIENALFTKSHLILGTCYNCKVSEQTRIKYLSSYSI